MNTEYVCIAVPLIELDTSLIHTEYLPNERVVRCRDCRFCRRCEAVFFADGKVHEGESWICSIVCETEWPGREFRVSPDGFCAWGEPREEPDA